MRMTVITRPEAGVAEATLPSGDATVAPFAGEDTAMPPFVGAGLLTLMFSELVKDCPIEFHATTTAECPPDGSARLVFRLSV